MPSARQVPVIARGLFEGEFEGTSSCSASVYAVLAAATAENARILSPTFTQGQRSYAYSEVKPRFSFTVLTSVYFLAPFVESVGMSRNATALNTPLMFTAFA